MEIVKQEQINERLQRIAMNLKSIASIGPNYMEYLAALIYTIYENKEEFGYIVKAGDIKFAVQRLDETLNHIRLKEKSEKLFRNIRFHLVLNGENSFLFWDVVFERLEQLILELEKIGDGKSKLAEAFEYVIMQAAQDSANSSHEEFFTPKEVVQTMINLLDVKPNMAIYNPACGTRKFYCREC